MTFLKVIEGSERKKIEHQLKDNYGIEEINGLMFMAGHERIFLFQGSLSKEGIEKIDRRCNVERVGVYFAKIIPGEDSVKLSIEGTHALASQIKKNIYGL